MAGNGSQVYGLDKVGVVVDTNPVNNPPAQLSKAQNAIAEPLGERGSIRKRPGLARFNGTAANGSILGGVGVPILLGSAGPDFQNPFIDLPVTAASYTSPTYTVSPRLGGTFSDESEYWYFDWYIELGIPELLFPIGDRNSGATEGPALSLFDDPTQVTTSDVNALASGDPAAAASPSIPTASSLATLIIIGSGTNWYLGFNTTLSEHASNATSYPHPKNLLFPVTSLRGSGPLTGWTTGGSTSVLQGRPMTVLNGVLYYAENGV